jgi:hypothetical protein
MRNPLENIERMAPGKIAIHYSRERIAADHHTALAKALTHPNRHCSSE